MPAGLMINSLHIVADLERQCAVFGINDDGPPVSPEIHEQSLKDALQQLILDDFSFDQRSDQVVYKSASKGEIPAQCLEVRSDLVVDLTRFCRAHSLPRSWTKHQAGIVWALKRTPSDGNAVVTEVNRMPASIEPPRIIQGLLKRS